MPNNPKLTAAAKDAINKLAIALRHAELLSKWPPVDSLEDEDVQEGKEIVAQMHRLTFTAYEQFSKASAKRVGQSVSGRTSGLRGFGKST